MLKKIYRLFSLLCTLAVVAYVAVNGYFYVRTIEARNIGSTFVTSLAKGDAQTASSTLDITLTQKIDVETLGKLSASANLSQYEKVDWKEWEIRGNIYEIQGKLHSNKGFSTGIILKFIQRADVPAPRIYAFEIKPVENLAALQEGAKVVPAPQAVPQAVPPQDGKK